MCMFLFVCVDLSRHVCLWAVCLSTSPVGSTAPHLMLSDTLIQSICLFLSTALIVKLRTRSSKQSAAFRWHESLIPCVTLHPQAARELRALGFKFGQLTPKQLTHMRSLYSKYRLEHDMSVLIAAELAGGWTSRQVTSLLRKHKLTGMCVCCL